MGFVVNDDTYRLKFTGGAMKGATIDVTDLDVRSTIRIQSMERGDDDDRFLTEAWSFFLRSLVDWDLEYVDRSGDTPVTLPLPRTDAALDHLGLRRFREIYRAWMMAITLPSTDVQPDPDGRDGLGKDSPGGEPALAGLPMTEPGSTNPPS